jgi:lipopolysaccharide transport system permease protein
MNGLRRSDKIDLASDSRNLFREIWAYRFALWNLILKDFRVRYRNMSLGMIWSILNPLVMLGVLVVVFSYIRLTSRPEEHFAIFLLLGMIPFNFFSMTLPPSTTCILDNTALVKKVIFPRHILPLSVVLAQIIHVVIQLCLLAIFLVFSRVMPNPAWIWLPVLFLVELGVVLGCALILSAMNVYYRDTLYLVQSGLAILFWFTPIFYPLSVVKVSLKPWIYQIYLLNPLTGIIDSFRRVVLEGKSPDGMSLGIATGMAGLLIVVGWAIFSRKERHFADKL